MAHDARQRVEQLANGKQPDLHHAASVLEPGEIEKIAHETIQPACFALDRGEIPLACSSIEHAVDMFKVSRNPKIEVSGVRSS